MPTEEQILPTVSQWPLPLVVLLPVTQCFMWSPWKQSVELSNHVPHLTVTINLPTMATRCECHFTYKPSTLYKVDTDRQLSHSPTGTCCGTETTPPWLYATFSAPHTGPSTWTWLVPAHSRSNCRPIFCCETLHTACPEHGLACQPQWTLQCITNNLTPFTTTCSRKMA